MTVFDVITSPWAIEPQKFQEVLEVYRKHANGEPRSLDAFFGIKERSVEEREAFEVVDGVAVLKLEGVLGKKFNMFTDISGGTSTQVFGNMLTKALADDSVRSIILRVDSPGGTVDGTQDLANAVFEARGQGKPIVAFTDGMMASAALWIGLAADEVVIGGDTTLVGSIGVVATHRDISRAEEMAGVKTTEVVSSRFKHTPSHLAPLSREGADILQANVDHIHQVFITELAKFRGTDAKTLNESAGDGRVFLGTKAIEVGLVDRVQGFNALLAEMQAGQSHTQGRKPAMSMKGNQPEGEGTVVNTVADLQSAFPELCKQLTDEASATGHAKGMDEGKKSGVEEGAKNERERIQAVEAQAKGFPGHSALIQQLKYDGKTTADQAAVQVLNAERSMKEKHGQDLHNDAPKPVDGDFSQDDITETTAQKRDRLIEEHMAADVQAYPDNGAKYKAALVAVSKKHSELFEVA